MSNRSPKRNKRPDYEIPCRLLPETENDMSQAVPTRRLLLARGVSDEQRRASIDVDFAHEANGQRKRKKTTGKQKKEMKD